MICSPRAQPEVNKSRIPEVPKNNGPDPGSIHATFGKMLESQGDIDKPKYDRVTQGAQVNNYAFSNIGEASSFWKSLWKKRERRHGSRMD